MDKKFKKQFELEDELLEIIDKRDEFTRSDLQGVVSAFVRKNMKGENLIFKKKGGEI